MRQKSEQNSEWQLGRQSGGAVVEQGSALTRTDLLWMTVGFLLCLLVAYTFGKNHIFWEDEMLGWMLLHDPSWSHMITAWKSGADGGGFTFYLLGRAWFALLGASDLSFRLFSASCFGAAFCVTWAAARRFYSATPVGFAMFNTWFFSPPMVTHMAEGRFYGLLVLSTSLVVWLVLAKAPNSGHGGRTRTLAPLIVLTFLFHALLTTSHTLGILYSAALLLALVVLDLQTNRLRIALYVSAALSWTLLIPERTAIHASGQVGQPWFWTRPPSATRILGAFTGFSNEIAALLFSLVILLVVSWNGQTKQIVSTVATGFRQRRPVYLVVAALCLVPTGMAIQSHFGTSLFIDRYLLPLNIGVALLTMEMLSLVSWRSFRIENWSPLSRYARITGAGAFAAVLLFTVFFQLRQRPIQARNYTDRLTARLPRGIPVLCEDAWIFTELMGRQHNSGVLYTYLLDWPQSISKTAPRLEVTQYHLMENWKKAGYFSSSIQSRDIFLQEHPRFLVLVSQDIPTDKYGRFIGNPLVDRFRNTPGYEVQAYSRGDANRRDDPNVWLVCRGSCHG